MRQALDLNTKTAVLKAGFLAAARDGKLNFMATSDHGLAARNISSAAQVRLVNYPCT